MPPLRAVLFDFDGTLVRSHGEVLAAITTLTKRRCAPPTADELRNLDTSQMLKRLNVPSWQVPWFVFRARRWLASRSAAIQFEPGVIDVVQALRARGLRVGLVSSNSRANVLRILDRHGVMHLFDPILCGSSLFGKHRTFARALKRLDVPAAAVVAIGDETRDIQAARRLGLRTVAVDWGFHSAARLRECRPDVLISNPSDLSRVLLDIV